MCVCTQSAETRVELWRCRPAVSGWWPETSSIFLLSFSLNCDLCHYIYNYIVWQIINIWLEKKDKIYEDGPCAVTLAWDSLWVSPTFNCFESGNAGLAPLFPACASQDGAGASVKKSKDTDESHHFSRAGCSSMKDGLPVRAFQIYWSCWLRNMLSRPEYQKYWYQNIMKWFHNHNAHENVTLLTKYSGNWILNCICLVVNSLHARAQSHRRVHMLIQHRKEKIASWTSLHALFSSVWLYRCTASLATVYWELHY